MDWRNPRLYDLLQEVQYLYWQKKGLILPKDILRRCEKVSVPYVRYILQYSLSDMLNKSISWTDCLWYNYLHTLTLNIKGGVQIDNQSII